MGTVYTGIVRGKTIELDEAPGLPDGESVRVTVIPSNGRKSQGKRIKLGSGDGSISAQSNFSSFLGLIAWRKMRVLGFGRMEVLDSCLI